jgi:hypothetical protein
VPETEAVDCRQQRRFAACPADRRERWQEVTEIKRGRTAQLQHLTGRGGIHVGIVAARFPAEQHHEAAAGFLELISAVEPGAPCLQLVVRQSVRGAAVREEPECGRDIGPGRSGPAYRDRQEGFWRSR